MQPVYVVTGLPRSGTSMLMQMLGAGGLSLYVDAERVADANNPRGYFEHRAVRRLAADASWIPEAAGRVVKIVLPLVQKLPPGLQYRVILLQRDVAEIVASQRAMVADVERLPRYSIDEEIAIFSRLYRESQSWLRRQHGLRLLTVAHRDLLQDTARQCEALAHFLDQKLDRDAMAGQVDAHLWRQRSDERERLSVRHREAGRDHGH